MEGAGSEALEVQNEGKVARHLTPLRRSIFPGNFLLQA